MPGANGNALAAAAFSRSGVRARADAEFGAERLGALEIVGVQDGADPDDGVRAPPR